MSITLLYIAGAILTILLAVIGSVSITQLMQKFRDAENKIPAWLEPYLPLLIQHGAPIAQEALPHVARASGAGLATIRNQIQRQVTESATPYDDIAAKPLLEKLDTLIAAVERLENRNIVTDMDDAIGLPDDFTAPGI